MSVHLTQQEHHLFSKMKINMLKNVKIEFVRHG